MDLVCGVRSNVCQNRETSQTMVWEEAGNKKSHAVCYFECTKYGPCAFFIVLSKSHCITKALQSQIPVKNTLLLDFQLCSSSSVTNFYLKGQNRSEKRSLYSVVLSQCIDKLTNPYTTMPETVLFVCILSLFCLGFGKANAF